MSALLHTVYVCRLAAVFDCPLVWYSSSDLSWQSLRYVHEASSAALAVDSQSPRAPAPPLDTGDKLRQLMLQLYLTGWTQSVHIFLYLVLDSRLLTIMLQPCRIFYLDAFGSE